MLARSGSTLIVVLVIVVFILVTVLLLTLIVTAILLVWIVCICVVVATNFTLANDAFLRTKPRTIRHNSHRLRAVAVAVAVAVADAGAADIPGVDHNKLDFAHRDSMSRSLVDVGRSLRHSALLVDDPTY